MLWAFQGISFLFLKKKKKKHIPITAFRLYHLSNLYLIYVCKKVFIAIVLRSQRLLAGRAWISLDILQPGTVYYSSATGTQYLPWNTFCDSTLLIAPMCDLGKRLPSLNCIFNSVQISIRLFLIHRNEHCLGQLKGWQFTVPALPRVTSVSAVKTHSRMNASQVPEDQDRQRVKEARER